MVILGVVWLVLGSVLFIAMRRLVRPSIPDNVIAASGGARPPTPTAGVAEAYRRASLRGRGVGIGAVAGVLLGLLVGGISFHLILLCCTVGVLVGVLAGEIAAEHASSDTRAATLTRRRLSDYASWPWRAAPVVGAVADIVVVAVGLRPHLTGPVSGVCNGVTWGAWVSWPSRPALFAALVASIGVVVLLGLVLRQVVRRSQSVADIGQMADDNALRAMTARQAIALAGAAQLFIFAGVAFGMVAGYVGPCQRQASYVADTAVVAFLSAIGCLFLAGSRRAAGSLRGHR